MQILSCCMQKANEKGLHLRIQLVPIYVCKDVADMRDKYVVYLPDMRIVVSVGGDLIVHCCHEMFSQCRLASIFHDVFANDLLNQPMNRHKISCRIIVVI